MSSPLPRRSPRKPLAIKLVFYNLPLWKLLLRGACGLPSHSMGWPRGWPRPDWTASLAVIAAVVTIFLVGLPVWSPVWSNDPAAVMEVCRAGVEPCQREGNAPVGEPVALDLFITSSTIDQEDQPLKLVAWETHFRLWGDGEFQLASQLPVGVPEVELPVREQGHNRYTLEGLLRQKDETPDPNADYYAVQNQFYEETGQLDYAVTLLDFGEIQPLAPLFSGSSRDRWLIGRIVFAGQGPGSIQVSFNAESSLPFQAISLSEAGERLPIPLTDGSPLATLRVGPPAEPWT